jgi:hypothetical protein
VPRFRYQKRVFLHPPSAGKNSYVCAVAESSDDGSYDLGNYILTLADCHRVVEIEFPLTNPYLRKQSLAKADLLLEVLGAFRDGLHAEAELIEKRSAAKR